MPTYQSPHLPLEGIKVIELSHLIAGPYCAQLMAEEGAQVIKIEPPEGELTRHREPIRKTAEGSVSAYFGALNRGKQSLALDLKTEAGKDVLHQLLASADVVVTNMRAAALDRLGIHPDSLRERYPQLIIACISGFGMEDAGEYAERAGLAMVAEALTGSTGLTRDHEGNPVWCGFALGDMMTGLTAHSAILLALRNQERHGTGQILDLSLIESTLPVVTVALARAQVAETAKSTFAGSNNFHGVPYGAFPASDGFVSIGVNRDEFWRRLCVAMQQPELGADPRYATYLARVNRQQEVHDITTTFTRAHSRAEIVEKLNKVDVPVSEILTMQEVAADKYMLERGALQHVDDGFGGTLVLPSNPTRVCGPLASPRIPRLGEHREAVLHGLLGLAADDIAGLAQRGAFGAVSSPPPDAAADPGGANALQTLSVRSNAGG